MALDLNEPGWYQALTLAERIALLRRGQDRIHQIGFNLDLAERRLRRWRAEPAFLASEDLFIQRLSQAGVTEDDLLCILGESPAELRRRLANTPAWLLKIVEAFDTPVYLNTPAIDEKSDGEIDGIANGFLCSIAPLIRRELEQVSQGIGNLAGQVCDLPFDRSTVGNLLLSGLPERLLAMMSRTLALELNVARLEGVLDGSTPEERFQSFLQRLRQPEIALSILQEYPVMARQLLNGIEQWRATSLEFARRLCQDWPLIKSSFSPDETGPLVGLQSGAGDRHQGGHSVMLLTFSSGWRLVYKPRPLAVDVHFQELLAWTNERCDDPTFRSLKILDRETYGWVEYVVADTCTSTEELQRFYRRQGGYLALLYALHATDFHYENLIAAGEHPVLIDLEALFHPVISREHARHPYALASDVLNDSVLPIGLLPFRLWASAGQEEGVELSGLGGAADQLTPHAVAAWDGVGTDEMRLSRRRLKMPRGRNRPSLHGVEVSLLDYVEEIVVGFTRIYRLLAERGVEFLSEEGMLVRFADDVTRTLVRPTQAYASMLSESFHPNLLRDALDRERFLDHLWINVESQPKLQQLIPHERADLLRGDIPVFQARPRSRDVWSSDNHCLPHLLEKSGLELARGRVRKLSDEDLSRQVWFIRSAMTALAANVEEKQRAPYRIARGQAETNREQLLAAARKVGERLEELALRGDDRHVGWIGLMPVRDRFWSLMPAGLDLYSGLPGIGLFLAYLGALVNEERYRALAERVALTILYHLGEIKRSDSLPPESLNILSGAIYFLTHIGALYDRPELYAEAGDLVELLPPLIAMDERLDILGGTAGCLASLISLHRCRPSDRTLAIAFQCGERLLKRAQAMKDGLGWATLPECLGPLTGFSHGAAGIAWSLLELWKLTSEECFRTAALGGIAYERRLFSKAMNNWPDLRVIPGRPAPEDGGHHYVVAWCHGAPGIGLSRLLASRHLEDEELRAEINAALKTTLARGFGFNHSLCHGDLGNLELLLQASEILGETELYHDALKIALMILQSIERDGWLCGVTNGVETPGLMVGLAGIGYGLLRVAEPTRMPSVLALASPVLIDIKNQK